MAAARSILVPNQIWAERLPLGELTAATPGATKVEVRWKLTGEEVRASWPSRALSDLVDLAGVESSGRLLTFVRRYGVLGLGEHGLPWTHQPDGCYQPALIVGGYREPLIGLAVWADAFSAINDIAAYLDQRDGPAPRSPGQDLWATAWRPLIPSLLLRMELEQVIRRPDMQYRVDVWTWPIDLARGAWPDPLTWKAKVDEPVITPTVDGWQEARPPLGWWTPYEVAAWTDWWQSNVSPVDQETGRRRLSVIFDHLLALVGMTPLPRGIAARSYQPSLLPSQFLSALDQMVSDGGPVTPLASGLVMSLQGWVEKAEGKRMVCSQCGRTASALGSPTNPLARWNKRNGLCLACYERRRSDHRNARKRERRAEATGKDRSV